MRKITNINWKIPPLDIMELIFSKLAIVNLPVCRLVCKAWNHLVLTCKFVPIPSFYSFANISPNGTLHCIDLDHKHLKEINLLASFTFHPRFSNIKIIGSYNGLLCFSTSCTKRAYVLNPMTNEYIELPTPDVAVGGRFSRYFYGFGFNPKSKQYKIVRISKQPLDTDTTVQILPFGTSFEKWESVSSLPHEINDDGVYLNGALYWIGRYGYENVVVRFDVEDEKFEEIYVPKVGREMNKDFMSIWEFNRHVHLSFFELQYCLGYHVWKMEEDYSWIKEFVIAMPIVHLYYLFWRPHDVEIIKALEDGKLVCVLSKMSLILYDPNTRKIETLHEELADDLSKELRIYQIQSFNFGSLQNILAGDV